MTPLTLASVAAISLVTQGCMTGPNYQRPPVVAPDAFRGVDAAPGATSLADERWSALFEDEVLQTLIRTALEHNYDIQTAAARILEAQAQLGVTHADQFPTVSAGVDVLGERPSVALGFPPRNIGAVAIQGSAAWELDFWGKFRRATESARAQLLAAEWGRRAVMTTLVSQVSSAYFSLRALDLELDISRRTLASRQESLELAQVRERGGVTSLLDVRQAEQLVYGATGEIATLERQIAQQENFISVLLGSNPAPIARGRALTEQPHQADVPAGLPSSLIERRPDIQRAEQTLVAANAQIGVARAAYFPQISLTGSGGFESTALATLFTGTSAIWTRGRGRHAADLHRGPHQIAGRARRGAPRGGGRRLPADDSTGVPRSLGRAGRLPQAARVPGAAGAVVHRGPGRPATRAGPLRGRRDELSRGARCRHAPVRRRARPGAGGIERADGPRRDLSRAGRRLAGLTSRGSA